jgi:hypothetical protein
MATDLNVTEKRAVREIVSHLPAIVDALNIALPNLKAAITGQDFADKVAPKLGLDPNAFKFAFGAAVRGGVIVGVEGRKRVGYKRIAPAIQSFPLVIKNDEELVTDGEEKKRSSRNSWEDLTGTEQRAIKGMAPRFPEIVQTLNRLLPNATTAKSGPDIVQELAKALKLDASIVRYVFAPSVTVGILTGLESRGKSGFKRIPNTNRISVDMSRIGEAQIAKRRGDHWRKTSSDDAAPDSGGEVAAPATDEFQRMQVLNPIERAKLNPNSRTWAIKAKCYECCCGEKKAVRDCGITTCPLFNFRPYQKRNDAEVDHEEEEMVAVDEGSEDDAAE